MTQLEALPINLRAKRLGTAVESLESNVADENIGVVVVVHVSLHHAAPADQRDVALHKRAGMDPVDHHSELAGPAVWAEAL